MKIRKLLKRCAPNETIYEALYKMLIKRKSMEIDELGEGMAVSYQRFFGWPKPRFILNHNTKTAFEFVDASMTLVTVTESDIDWNSIEDLPEHVIEHAQSLTAMFPISIGLFHNGVARVSWQINPDGRFYQDDDGFGMTNDVEVEVYGYINKMGMVVGKFRLPRQNDDEAYFRTLAEKVEQTNFESGIS